MAALLGSVGSSILGIGNSGGAAGAAAANKAATGAATTSLNTLSTQGNQQLTTANQNLNPLVSALASNGGIGGGVGKNGASAAGTTPYAPTNAPSSYSLTPEQQTQLNAQVEGIQRQGQQALADLHGSLEASGIKPGTPEYQVAQQEMQNLTNAQVNTTQAQFATQAQQQRQQVLSALLQYFQGQQQSGASDVQASASGETQIAGQQIGYQNQLQNQANLTDSANNSIFAAPIASALGTALSNKLSSLFGGGNSGGDFTPGMAG